MKNFLLVFLFIPLFGMGQIPSTENLRGIHFYTSSHGVIVTESGHMYQTTNAGYTWTALPQVTTSYLRYYAESDPNTSYFTGDNGVLLKSVDKGYNWTTINSGTTTHLGQMTFTDPQTAYLVGFNGFAKKSINGCNTWTEMNVPTSFNLISVEFANQNTGFIGGLDQVFATYDAGLSWNPIINSPGIGFEDICFTDNLHGVIAGWAGMVFITEDGGLNWDQVESGVTENLYDITFSTPTTGFIIGRQGTMIRTNDGGHTWSSIILNPINPVNCMAEFTNGLSGYMVANMGTVYYTVDSGYTWSITPPAGLGISDILTPNLAVSCYPNPVNDMIYLNINAVNNKELMFEGYDITGRSVIPSTSINLFCGVNQVQIPVTNLPTGVYLLNLRSDNEIHRLKFQIIR